MMNNVFLKKRLNYNLRPNEQHPFHLVDTSPWPLITSLSLLSFCLSFVMYFHFFLGGTIYFIENLFLLCFFLCRWFADIIMEATHEGNHTYKVQQGVRMGMCLFIASEIMFFFSFFWAFFHASLAPPLDTGGLWPPLKLETLDSWGLPILNTLILLSSGMTITWAHRAMLHGNRNGITDSLIATIVYGLFFTSIQYYEYAVGPFSINDSSFGSLFFMLTGFHGIHVLIGTIFLIVCLFRHLNYHFTDYHHVGFEAAAWYWHFVDGAGTK